MAAETEIKFAMLIAGNSAMKFIFHPDKADYNWSWTLGSISQQLNLDFQKSLSLLMCNRPGWKMLIKALFDRDIVFGLHHRGPAHLAKRICLNFFGHQNVVRVSNEILEELCHDHVGGEEIATCFQCGVDYNEEEEEEKEALVCDCGFVEEECQCPRCEVCGQRNDACKCEICDSCELCLCEDEDHKQTSHRPCDCEEQCSPTDRITKHEIKNCQCSDKRCKECDLTECDCESESKSQEYAFNFDE